METIFEVTFWLGQSFDKATYQGSKKSPLETLNKAWFPGKYVSSETRSRLFTKLNNLERVRIVLTARQLANFFVMRRQDKTGVWLNWDNAIEIKPQPQPETPIDITLFNE